MEFFGDFGFPSRNFKGSSLTESYPRDSGSLFGEYGLVRSVPHKDVTMAELGLIAAVIVTTVVEVEDTNPTQGSQESVPMHQSCCLQSST